MDWRKDWETIMEGNGNISFSAGEDFVLLFEHEATRKKKSKKKKTSEQEKQTNCVPSRAVLSSTVLMVWSGCTKDIYGNPVDFQGVHNYALKARAACHYHNSMKNNSFQRFWNIYHHLMHSGI